MTYQDALKDYIEVKDRIQEFYKLYPNGSLQFEYGGLIEIGNQKIIWGQAYAYRSQDDLKPGIGTAWELVPGKSSFSRGSELMVLETSAWGRAIAALGIAVSKSVASKNEVMRAQSKDPWDTPPDSPKKAVEADLSVLGARVVGEYADKPKTPPSAPTTSNMTRPASEKQVNYFKSLMYKAWEACGYQGKPTEEDMVSFVNEMTKSNFASVSDWTARVMKDMLDDQSNLQQNLMSWNKDSRLWQSEVF